MVIPFEEEYRKKFYELEHEIFESNFWSEGKMIRTFEESLASMSSWAPEQCQAEAPPLQRFCPI